MTNPYPSEEQKALFSKVSPLMRCIVLLPVNWANVSPGNGYKHDASQQLVYKSSKTLS